VLAVLAPRPLSQGVGRRSPSRVINERRHQRIIGALVNSPVEDERVPAFDSFVVGETGCVQMVVYYD